jgi:ribosomal protein S18 acetylase RimI-like enzyme
VLNIRPAKSTDRDAVWSVIEPVIRAGDTYTLACDLSKNAALEYWFSPAHEVFVADDLVDGPSTVVGAYYLRSNQQGGGSHVANCGYITAPAATGKGIASAMCAHSLDRARARNFKAMQFNFVVSTNDRAVRLWQRHGFQIVGTLPKAFLHPQQGYVHAYVMYREL